MKNSQVTEAAEVLMSLDDAGVLQFRLGDQFLSAAQKRDLKLQAAAEIEQFIHQQCTIFNAGFDSLSTFHLLIPDPHDRPRFLARELPVEPSAPLAMPVPWYARLLPMIFSSTMKRIEQRDRHASEAYEEALEDWHIECAAIETWNMNTNEMFNASERGDLGGMAKLLFHLLQKVVWPRETMVDICVADAMRVSIDIDYPEIEDFPSRVAELRANARGLKYKKLSDTKVRRTYAAHIHAVSLFVIGTAFAALPTVQEVVSSGYSQRPDPKTGTIGDEYLLSLRVRRSNWEGIAFDNLDGLDPVEAVTRFEHRRKMTKTGMFKVINPIQMVEPASGGSP